MELKHSQHSVPTTLSSTTIFSKYSPQTSQIQFLEEASTGLCVEAIPLGPHTLHRDVMTPPPPSLLEYYRELYFTTLYYIMGNKKIYQPFEDGFWCSRCLNDHVEVPDMIGSLPSGATASLVAKNGTKKLSQLFEDRFWCSRCLNDHSKVPKIIGSFASSSTASLLAKNETKNHLIHFKTDFDVKGV